jgi:transcriptional regulator with XRE-family HTH domain
MLSRLSKLALLFFSPNNPLWQSLLQSKHITYQSIASTAGISQSTLGNWKKNGPINLSHLEKVFKTLQCSIEKNSPVLSDEQKYAITLIKNFAEKCAHMPPGWHVYDVAREILSIPMDECQRVCGARRLRKLSGFV